MIKKKAFTLFALTLLIFQMFNPIFDLFGQAVFAEGSQSIKVTHEKDDQDSVTWKLTVSAKSEEDKPIKTHITFGTNQTHGTIESTEDLNVTKENDGYTITSDQSLNNRTFNIQTKRKDKTNTDYTMKAKLEVDGTTVSDSANATVAPIEVEQVEEEPVKEEAVQEEKKEDRPEKPEEVPKEEEKNEEKPQENESKKTDKQDESETEANEEKEDKESDATEEELEDEYIPVEQYGAQSSAAGIPYSAPKLRTMSSNSQPKATHKIETPTSDNICIREVDGEVNFTLPAPEEKMPVDIVVVQDASGSYGGNSNQAKQSLRDIVDMLDLSQDRMMVTSYRGYDGWRSYNNLAAFDNGNIRSSNGKGRNEQDLTLTNHTGLSSNAQSLKSGINQITFDGATPTASGLQFAKNQYEAATAGQDLSDRETIFILITDGVANAMLDGRIHIEYNGGFLNPHSWAERYQFYERTFSEVLGVANSIKSQGYTLVSAYWENKSILQEGYGTSYYNNTIGPAARAMVQNAASSPNLYNDNEDLAQAMADLLANLQTVLNEYNGFETTFDIAPGFELVDDSIYVNGSQAQYSVSGSTVTVTADKIPSGDNTLTYKLKETSVHGDTTTPISNGTIHYDKSNGSFKSSVNIQNAHLAGNANSELCVTKVNKFVSKGDSGDFTDSIDLDEMNETFTYKLEYQFGEDVAGADTVQLKDELVSVLELVGDEDDITIASAIAGLSSTTTLLTNNDGFTIDLDKQNDSYDYLAGKKITVTFKAKIKDNTSIEDLNQYRELGIPNKATLVIDGEPEHSEDVYVNPPKFGTIKIVKVDANDHELKLEGAIFDLKDSDGNIVDTLTTDSNGTATSKELLAGEYTLVETEAPTGYDLLTSDLTVNIEPGLEKTKTIKNERLKGSITITKIGDDTNEALQGASFELSNEDGVVETKTSDQNGKITFTDLEWGTYTIKETKAPEGYRLLTQEIKVEITKDDLNIEKDIENTPIGWEIPDTGGPGTSGFYVAGFILMLAALLLTIYRRHTL